MDRIKFENILIVLLIICLLVLLFVWIQMDNKAEAFGLLKPGTGGGILAPLNLSLLDIIVNSLKSSSSTLGIVNSGTWQGSLITNTYIASSSYWSGKQDALSTIAPIFSYQNISTTTIITNATSTFIGLSSTSTITLPSATSSQGLVLIFKDINGIAPTSTLQIQTSTSSQVIDNSTSTTISSQYGSLKLFSNGANWYKF